MSGYLDAEDEDAGWVATSGRSPQLRGTLQQNMPADHIPTDRVCLSPRSTGSLIPDERRIIWGYLRFDLEVNGKVFLIYFNKTIYYHDIIDYRELFNLLGLINLINSH